MSSKAEKTATIQFESPSAQIPSKQEMPLLCESVRNSIRQLLYLISTVIRRPIPVDRLLRAAEIPVQHFKSFDQQHVEECFPQAT